MYAPELMTTGPKVVFGDHTLEKMKARVLNSFDPTSNHIMITYQQL